MTIEEAKKFLEDNQIKYILAQFVDIHGVAKTKSVPASCLESIVEDGAGFAGFAVWGLGMEPHDGDYMAKADLSTLSIVPWQPGYARVACTGHVHDKPYEYDTRHIMLKQIERLSEKGWTLNTGIEPEFSLLKRNEDGHLMPYDESDTLDKPCYDYKGLSRSRAFLEKFVDSLQQVGFDVYQIDHEDANGQFEINYTYSDAKTSADRITFVRMAGSEIANEMGMICSFMPKPNANRTGNGFHFHLSITDDQGNNLFKDDSDKNNMGLSELAYDFLGGLMHHAKALCAFAAPTVNSYKRLVVGRSLSGATWAPAFISYGDNNRSAMVRVPYGRLEFRLPDTGCNPYLVTAAIIAAGLDGVAKKLNPGEPQNINHYGLSLDEIKARGIDTLPQSLSEALDELEEDSLFVEQFGENFMKEFIDIKRMEWVEYQRHVSDWELNRYAEYF
ncbi:MULTISPECIES: type III glutamate--ammonia ligase [Piscirickettsiaceae]|jgi:glutamine synthetase|uniref:Type III glutamate--ammonia ligase n=1 Tax=Hydrogenovibrio thermophilus TaxID=265883 RepID=A0A410H518_9GAMM|nr:MULTISPECIES: type III glutamate--ammonia ligase [Piscirickettsiaceae]AZR81325.1 glutamine synthetase [Thiomicrospira sp. S5]AZR81494.1 glutamine synthetase [Thiomicrospira sp. S5]QAB16024.1 type III glutamate--ammonia ligase [Hydrogenovibrio thermophilus]